MGFSVNFFCDFNILYQTFKTLITENLVIYIYKKYQHKNSENKRKKSQQTKNSQLCYNIVLNSKGI